MSVMVGASLVECDDCHNLHLGIPCLVGAADCDRSHGRVLLQGARVGDQLMTGFRSCGGVYSQGI